MCINMKLHIYLVCYCKKPHSLPRCQLLLSSTDTELKLTLHHSRISRKKEHGDQYASTFQIASRNVHQHIFCCDKETAWIKITFLVKTIVRCVLVDGDLGRGVNPGVSKYGGPNEWSSGLVVKDEKGNVVTGIVGVHEPSSSSSSSSSDGGS